VSAQPIWRQRSAVLHRQDHTACGGGPPAGRASLDRGCAPRSVCPPESAFWLIGRFRPTTSLTTFRPPRPNSLGRRTHWRRKTDTNSRSLREGKAMGLRLSCRRLRLATPGRAFRRSGTDGSNPVPSSRESANDRFRSLSTANSPAASAPIAPWYSRKETDQRVTRSAMVEGGPCPRS
jgi:hypothetical protein